MSVRMSGSEGPGNDLNPTNTTPVGEENGHVGGVTDQRGWIGRHKLLTSAGVAVVLISLTASGATLLRVGPGDTALAETTSVSPAAQPAPTKSAKGTWPVEATEEPEPPEATDYSAPADSSVGQESFTTSGSDSSAEEWTEPAPSQESISASEKSDVKEFAKNLVEDIASVDERLSDGIQVESALDFVGGTLESLSFSPAPPNANEVKYFTLLDTTAQFMYDASYIYESDPMDATAKYLVARERLQAGVLDPINQWLGTSYHVPPSDYPMPGN